MGVGNRSTKLLSGCVLLFVAYLGTAHPGLYAVGLRWLHTGGGLGDAVLITEQVAPLSGWSAEPVPVIEVIDGSYALWGRRFEPLPTGKAGWCRAFEGRLGWLDVPLRGRLPPPGVPEHGWPEAYLSLICREYVIEDEYGNAEVVEERLVAIQTAAPTRGKVLG